MYLVLTEYLDHGILSETLIPLNVVPTHWVNWLVCILHTDGLYFKLRFSQVPFYLIVAVCSPKFWPSGVKIFKQQNTVFSPSAACLEMWNLLLPRSSICIYKFFLFMIRRNRKTKKNYERDTSKKCETGDFIAFPVKDGVILGLGWVGEVRMTSLSKVGEETLIAVFIHVNFRTTAEIKSF